MTAVVPPDGLILERVLDLHHRLRWTHGLSRHTYGWLEVAQTKTAWRSRRRQRVALLKGDADVLASATLHLDRDIDLLEYAIITKRLLAGLAPEGTRQLLFFIAEEGITAAAYVIISVAADTWTIEECGDRDPSGARLGAMLQALIAREPAERHPIIQGWLPPGCSLPR